MASSQVERELQLGTGSHMWDGESSLYSFYVGFREETLFLLLIFSDIQFLIR